MPGRVAAAPGWGKWHRSLHRLRGELPGELCFWSPSRGEEFNLHFLTPLKPGNTSCASEALGYKASLEILKYEAFLMQKPCSELQIIEYWPHFNRQRGDDWSEIHQLDWSGCSNASFVRGGKWHWPLPHHLGTFKGCITRSFITPWTYVNGKQRRKKWVEEELSPECPQILWA